MKRTTAYAIIGGAAAVAVILFLALYPLPRSHQASISLPAPAEVSPSLCGTAIENETFPSWFAGPADLHWSSGGIAVSLWVNQSSSSGGRWTSIYTAAGDAGATSFSINDAAIYQFTAQNCHPVATTVTVSVSVPYTQPIL